MNRHLALLTNDELDDTAEPLDGWPTLTEMVGDFWADFDGDDAA